MGSQHFQVAAKAQWKSNCKQEKQAHQQRNVCAEIYNFINISEEKYSKQ